MAVYAHTADTPASAFVGSTILQKFQGMSERGINTAEFLRDYACDHITPARRPENSDMLDFHVRGLTSALRENRSLLRLPLAASGLRVFTNLSSKSFVYMFDEGLNYSRNAAIRGGKGFGLAELMALRMPVPPGATITTAVSQEYLRSGQMPEQLAIQLGAALRGIETKSGLELGSSRTPLLLSVRSGARVSMPGMMDTVLNVGLNDETVYGLGRRAGFRFAWDTYRRFLSMFGTTVMGVDKHLFETSLVQARASCGAQSDGELPPEQLKLLCHHFKWIIETACNRPVPQDPMEQLTMAILAVLGSWQSDRCIAYRQSEKVPDDWGTAVNIQAMVFGNLGPQSGTGVVFSHDPATGEAGLYGEYLVNAQGEDVVSGARTPVPISFLRQIQPQAYEQLETLVGRLEARFDDMMDVEFTIEDGELFILQCRSAKRTVEASAVFAVSRVQKGLWSRKRALESVKNADFARLERQGFDKAAVTEASAVPGRLICQGLGASPGAATGKLAFTCQKAISWAAAGESVILMRPDTSPEDLPGMLVSAAIVTALGGSTSHAAVVARGKNIPAVVGCDFTLSTAGSCLLRDGRSLNEGDQVSVDGETGMVILGTLPTRHKALSPAMSRLLSWHQENTSLETQSPIDETHLDCSYRLNILLNDFYLTNLMASEAGESPIAQEAIKLRNQVEDNLASIFVTYLSYAVATEVRYYPEHSRRWNRLAAWHWLKSAYKVTRKGKYVTADLAQRELAEQIEYFHLCATVFDSPQWGCAYGGPLWAKIARTPLDYLTGDLPRSVFIDRVFDLEHNCGSVFTKHKMVSQLLNITYMRCQLNTKKQVAGVGPLKEALSVYATFSPDVLALYDAGLQAALWAAPVKPATNVQPTAHEVSDGEGQTVLTPAQSQTEPSLPPAPESEGESGNVSKQSLADIFVFLSSTEEGTVQC